MQRTLGFKESLLLVALPGEGMYMSLASSNWRCSSTFGIQVGIDGKPLDQHTSQRVVETVSDRRTSITITEDVSCEG
jgi:hypothetical protein